MKALRSVKWSMLLMGLITAAVGAIIVFHPKATAETVIRIAGWILVAAGGLSLLAFLADKKKGERFEVVGHVLAEFFNPGDYFETDKPAFFFRWQVEFKF